MFSVSVDEGGGGGGGASGGGVVELGGQGMHSV